MDVGKTKARKYYLSSQFLIILVSGYFLLILNLSLWRFVWAKLSIDSVLAALFGLSLIFALFLSFLVLFQVILWPLVGKPLLIALILVASLANYAMFQYGIFLDSTMARNILETNPREALEYLNLALIVWLVATGLIPMGLILKASIVFQPFWLELRKRLLVIFVCLLAIIALVGTFYKSWVIFGRNNRAITRLINPTNFLYSFWRHYDRERQAKRPLARLDPAARLAVPRGGPTTVFVLFLGESARASNFSLNGYPRNTNPRLSQQEVISFKDVTASATSTAIAVPAMFSPEPRSRFDLKKAHNSENLIDLLAQVGYRIIWLDNDNGCKKVCDRVFTRNIDHSNSPGRCQGKNCLDEALIDHLTKALSEIETDTVIVLHGIGSHGPAYYQRYPREFQFFEPTCETSAIQNCPKGQIVNSYDNTILYTDHVLNLAIEALKSRPDLATGLLYVSDHGESLGEGGFYLHGLPFSIAPDEQIKVPLIIWLSETLQIDQKIDYSCLRANSSEPHSHHNLFHSLAGLLNVQTRHYDLGLDFFATCRVKNILEAKTQAQPTAQEPQSAPSPL
jgi:lipid A ethanolaminephosphotransferase